MPYVEPPYPLPDAHMFTPPAIPRLDPAGAMETTDALQLDVLRQERLRRYWAAVTAAGDGVRPAALKARPASPPSVVPRADSLHLHRPEAACDPFERLIEHTLHVHLHPDPDA